MPELPEVETVRRVVEPQIAGRTILSVTVKHPQVIASPEAEEFCHKLNGQQIAGMERRGKFLTICTDDHRVTLHLRMTGSLLVTPADYEVAKHTHLIIRLDDQMEVRFIDTRRFGRFWLLDKDAEDTVTGIHRLGLEPFDERLTAQYLQEKLAGKKKTVKECLLDQSIVAGIGNIYADEILFRVRIHPQTKAGSLSFDELARLSAEIPQALSYYIEKNQISPKDYLAGKGRDYRNTPYLRVYGHGNEPCPVCGAILCKEVIGGRGSVFCPMCQKRENRSL